MFLLSASFRGTRSQQRDDSHFMTCKTFQLLNICFLVFCFINNHLWAETRWFVMRWSCSDHRDRSGLPAVNLLTIFLNVLPSLCQSFKFPLFSSVVLDPHPSERRQSQAQHARHPADKSSDHSRAQTTWRELQRDEVRSGRSGLWHSLAVIEESFQILLNCQGWKPDSIKQGLSLRGSCSCVHCLLRSSSSQADWIWPDASNRIPSALLASHLMSENSVQRARTLKTLAP